MDEFMLTTFDRIVSTLMRDLANLKGSLFFSTARHPISIYIPQGQLDILDRTVVSRISGHVNISAPPFSRLHGQV
jgi:hypothetical protein